jgi:hypothetical protein
LPSRGRGASFRGMERYGSGRDTGVVAFEAGPDFIRLEFTDGRVYTYDATAPGADHVEEMKALALRGRGLTTYINQHVRGNYARRDR